MDDVVEPLATSAASVASAGKADVAGRRARYSRATPGPAAGTSRPTQSRVKDYTPARNEDATPPPVGNTGVEMTGVGLGWLQGTVWYADRTLVVSVLEAHLWCDAGARFGGTRWYAESVSIGPHALAAWSPRDRPDVPETYFEVRQSALDGLGGKASLKLAADLLALGARFTRADGFYDDRARHAEPAIVAEAFRRGNVVSHVRRMRVFSAFASGVGDVGVIPDGSTVYVGSSQSGKMLRVYDKAAESGDPEAGVRWELQLRGKQAAMFVAGATEAGDELGAYVLGCIRGLVDFRDRTGQERGDRSPLLCWWATIVADADRVRLSEPVKVDTLAGREAWLQRQAAPSLALLYFAAGADWLNELLRNGERRLTAGDYRLLGSRHVVALDEP
jgi:Replication initiation factor